MAIEAEVIQILNRIGVKGVVRVKCKLRNRDKIVTRNVVGPVRIGDVLILKEIEMD